MTTNTPSGTRVPTPATSYRILRLMVFWVMGTVAVVAAAGLLLARSPKLGMPTIGFLIAQLVVAALAWGLIVAVRNNAPAVTMEMSPEEVAQLSTIALQTRTMLRIGVSSFVGFLSLGLALAVLHGGGVLAVFGGVIAELLLASYALPTRRNIRSLETLLDRKGCRSGLSAAVGLEPGPIRAL